MAHLLRLALVHGIVWALDAEQGWAIAAGAIQGGQDKAADDLFPTHFFG